MKKSNIILIILFVGLYGVAIGIWGNNKISSAGDYLTGFGDNYRIIKIENPELKKDDIIVNTEPAFKSANSIKEISYLYYKGNNKILPEVSEEGDILVVGKATKASSDAKLKLHIHINNITEIILNDEVVWTRR